MGPAAGVAKRALPRARPTVIKLPAPGRRPAGVALPETAPHLAIRVRGPPLAVLAPRVAEVRPGAPDLIAVPPRPLAPPLVAPPRAPVPGEVPLIARGQVKLATLIANTYADVGATSPEVALTATVDPPIGVEGAGPEATQVGARQAGPPRPRVAPFAPGALQPQALLARVRPATLAGA